ILINSFERDLNGDGFQEYIRLNGSLMSNESNFFQDVWVTIEDAFEDEWSISLQHGYHPELTFKDLTGNKNPDIFYKVYKDEDSVTTVLNTSSNSKNNCYDLSIISKYLATTPIIKITSTGQRLIIEPVVKSYSKNVIEVADSSLGESKITKWATIGTIEK